MTHDRSSLRRRRAHIGRRRVVICRYNGTKVHSGIKTEHRKSQARENSTAGGAVLSDIHSERKQYASYASIRVEDAQPMRVLQANVTKESLLTVRRSSRWKKRMVYLLVADKHFRYNSGRRSRIIYIGTTAKGASRPASSAVSKASDAFKELTGVRQIDTHIVTCRGRKRIRTWEHLESALLATFRDLH
jgi:hypothetical protein